MNILATDPKNITMATKVLKRVNSATGEPRLHVDLPPALGREQTSNPLMPSWTARQDAPFSPPCPLCNRDLFSNGCASYYLDVVVDGRSFNHREQVTSWICEDHQGCDGGLYHIARLGLWLTHEGDVYRDPADFEAALARWLAGAKAIVDNRYSGSLSIPAPRGRKYIRIVQTSLSSGGPPQRSVYAFVDAKTGDVLKPSGWKGPAKRARGNIFGLTGGLACVSEFGIAYLK